MIPGHDGLDAPCFDVPIVPGSAMQPPGAVRAFTRVVEGTSLLAVTAGPGFAEQPGDQLISIWWMPSEADALRVEAACLDLLAAARFHVSLAGFSAFPAGKLRNLIGQAFLRASAEPLQRQPGAQERSVKKPWTRERCARLGYLIGRGLEAKDVAIDPDIDSSAAGVHKQANRLGLTFSEVPDGQLTVRLPRDSMVRFRRAAMRHNLTPETLLRRLADQIEDLAPALFRDARSDMISL